MWAGAHSGHATRASSTTSITGFGESALRGLVGRISVSGESMEGQFR